jgi:hypothetical protein
MVANTIELLSTTGTLAEGNELVAERNELRHAQSTKLVAGWSEHHTLGSIGLQLLRLKQSMLSYCATPTSYPAHALLQNSAAPQ